MPDQPPYVESKDYIRVRALVRGSHVDGVVPGWRGDRVYLTWRSDMGNHLGWVPAGDVERVEHLPWCAEGEGAGHSGGSTLRPSEEGGVREMSSRRLRAVLLAGMLALPACSGADAPPGTTAHSPVETTSKPTPEPVAPGLTVSYGGDPCGALTADVVAQFIPEASLQPIDAGPQTQESLLKSCGYGSLSNAKFVLLSVPNGRPFTTGGFSRYRTGEGPWEGCGTSLARRETTVDDLPALILTCGADAFAMAIGSPLDDRLSTCLVKDVGTSEAVAEQLCQAAFARVTETSTAPSR